MPPMYLFECGKCWRIEERLLPIDQRDGPQICQCGDQMRRSATAAAVRIPGSPHNKINYADQFTADMLGVPAKELPSGIRTPKVTA